MFGELIEKLKLYPSDMPVYGGTDHFGDGLEIRHIHTCNVAAHEFLSLVTEYPGPEPD